MYGWHLREEEALRGEGIRAVRSEGRRAEGSLNLSGGDADVTLAVRDFWQNYPKAIATGDDAIEYELIPDRDDPFEVACGIAKTHTMYLCFHDGRAETLPLRDLAFTIQCWPVPVARGAGLRCTACGVSLPARDVPLLPLPRQRRPPQPIIGQSRRKT